MLWASGKSGNLWRRYCSTMLRPTLDTESREYNFFTGLAPEDPPGPKRVFSAYYSRVINETAFPAPQQGGMQLDRCAESLVANDSP